MLGLHRGCPCGLPRLQQKKKFNKDKFTNIDNFNLIFRSLVMFGGHWYDLIFDRWIIRLQSTVNVINFISYLNLVRLFVI